MASPITPFEPEDRLAINPLFLFQWEETQGAYVLLYPEGVVKLNGTAAEILKRCDGERTVAQLVAELKRLYSAPDAEIESGIRKFLEISYAKGWIRHKA